MSAKDDYERAKQFVAQDTSGLPLVDRLRSLITSIRIEERTFASDMAKQWATSLEEVDEGFTATWIRDLADSLKTHEITVPVVEPRDPLDFSEPLEAIEENEL